MRASSTSEPEGSDPARSTSAAAIEARDLARRYQVGGTDVLALRGVSLTVSPGEFLGLVGVSGSGKSTLLHLMGGLDTPTSGEVSVVGQRLDQLTSRQRSMFRRTTIGFIFQSFYLVPTLTAAANIELALTLQGVYGSTRKQLAGEALQRVGLAERRDHRPGQLSVGQQQRVAVARAIVHRPQVILADEPTANLDRDTATQLMDLLAEINHDLAATVVMVTHDSALADSYCTRIVRMSDGLLADQETPA